MTQELETNGDVLSREDIKFKEAVTYIKNKRMELGIDKVKKSDRWITMMIVKHNFFKTIMEEIIKYDDEK